LGCIHINPNNITSGKKYWTYETSWRLYQINVFPISPLKYLLNPFLQIIYLSRKLILSNFLFLSISHCFILVEMKIWAIVSDYKLSWDHHNPQVWKPDLFHIINVSTRFFPEREESTDCSINVSNFYIMALKKFQLIFQTKANIFFLIL
jgi:hypothetical protein